MRVSIEYANSYPEILIQTIQKHQWIWIMCYANKTQQCERIFYPNLFEKNLSLYTIDNSIMTKIDRISKTNNIEKIY